ncbi:hypothetical protein TNCV_4510871 [Trichonephila clavipes]|nr:hypothetical protein TNCV_4510871 [Trichonephila clavipes]
MFGEWGWGTVHVSSPHDHGIKQGWTDFSRVRTTSNRFKVLRSTRWRRRGKAVFPKGLDGSPVDRDPPNAQLWCKYTKTSQLYSCRFKA